MKNYLEIIEELKETQKEITKLQEDNKWLYTNIIRSKETQEKMDKAAEEFDRNINKIKEIKIRQNILLNNAKVAFYYQTMPIVLEVLQKYNGKPYGTKTREKITKEVKEKTGACFHISSTYSIRYILYRPDFMAINIEIGARYEDGEHKYILIDNKIQQLNMNDLQIYYINTEYIDDIEERINTLNSIYELAVQKQEELQAICSQFNNLRVGDIDNIRVNSNIYTNGII